MKNILIVLGAVVSIMFPAAAQLEEGVISYDIEISTDDPQMSMVVGMMEGSTSTTTFQGEKVRLEVEMGSVMAQTIVVNKEANPQMIMLMDGMMGQMAIPTENLEEAEAEEEEKPELEVEVTTETKEVLGYKCTKAIVTDEDGNEMTFWCTEEISSKANANGQYKDLNLPGFPLEFETYANKMHMVFTAYEVETKLPKKKDGLFSTETPKGFKEVSKEDLKKMGM